MPERTDYWPDSLTKAVVTDWRNDMTLTSIALKHGLTRNQVAGKIHRLKARRDDRGEIIITRRKMGRPVGRVAVPWDERLFEPWEQRKARLARERGRS